MTLDANRTAVILGAADGLTLAISLIMALRHQQMAVFHAALGAGLGELVGMGAAVWLSSHPRRLLPAFGCGVATAIACITPAVPWLVTSGWTAMAWALGITVALGAAICWLRPERGWVAVATTYGVLAAAGLLCYCAALI